MFAHGIESQPKRTLIPVLYPLPREFFVQVYACENGGRREFKTASQSTACEYLVNQIVQSNEYEFVYTCILAYPFFYAENSK